MVSRALGAWGELAFSHAEALGEAGGGGWGSGEAPGPPYGLSPGNDYIWCLSGLPEWKIFLPGLKIGRNKS